MEETNWIILEGIKITDWIKSIGVLLGIPTAIWGVIKLFKKDSKHEQRINKLSDLVESQNGINESLQGQLKELKEHTEELHKRNLFQIDSNKMQKKDLNLKIKRYDDERNLKYLEIKQYVTEQF